MPYHVEPVHGGYYVVGPEGRKSKSPLTLERAHAQMRALYANVPDAREPRTPVKPRQIQERQKAAAKETPTRARGGRVNLSGKQKKSKLKSEMPPPPAAVAAPGAMGPMAPMAPGIPPVGMMANKPGYKSGGTRNFIKKAVGDNKGKFSAKAKAAGKTTAEYASEKASAPGTLGKEARLAETLMHLRRRK